MPFTVKSRERKETIKYLVLSLSECTPEEKKQRICSIRVLYALEMFDMKKYSQAMTEFVKLNTDPANVIKLFPELDSKPSGEKVEVKKIKAKDLDSALNALSYYLVKAKANILKSLESPKQTQEGSDGQNNVTQQLELIDTTLLKCYVQINPPMVAVLIRRNNCNFEETEKVLLHHGKFVELLVLYQTKEQHVKALQLLREHSKLPNSSLGGYEETKAYLQQLGAVHIKLILEFSSWILKEHPEEGLRIFTDDLEAVRKLPRQKILDFLYEEHETLTIPYLEHVIHTWNESNPIFHDALINRYKEKVMGKDNKITDEELERIKLKLLTFLENSAHYTPKLVLDNFPTNSLLEERAIALGKLGKHKEALAIYVFILGDIKRAVRYCENVCATPSNKNRDVFVILMRFLINPERGSSLKGPLASIPKHPNTSVADLETALYLLDKYANKISPLKALSVLPDSIPLCRLKYFLENALDSQHALARRMQVFKGLSYAEHTQVLKAKHFYESKSIVVTEFNVCQVCKKRFGNQSAIVSYPGGDIVHYSCKNIVAV